MSGEPKHLRGQVPDDPRELMGEETGRDQLTQYQFHEEAYEGIAPPHTGAAEKLADSGIAPIVAAARGYWTATDATSFKQLMDDIGVQRTSAQRRLKSTFTDEGQDVLAMPWYHVQDLDKDHAQPASHQWRPAKPRMNPETDKPVKYETPSKDVSVLPTDIHPATPADWLDEAPTILFAEGMLKGDAALSAYLAAHGADANLLATAGPEARGRLREFMETIDESDRILILRPSSVTTFHTDPAIHSVVGARGREVWIGVDGDVSTNGMVWDQTQRMIERMTNNGASHVYLLAPQDENDAKAGLDDYLSHTGDWDDLLSHVAAHLPPRPTETDEDLREGAWRIAESGTYCERKVVSRDHNNAPTGSAWVPTDVDFGAVVTSFIIRRTPTEEEMKTGVLAEGVFSKEDEVELLFKWTRDGGTQTATVVMPADVMDLSVETWGSKGALIPHNLRMHPSWPPRGSDGVSFMEAVRRSSKHQDHRVYWKRNGWVPVENSTPAFIVGHDVVCADEGAAATTYSDVSKGAINSFSSYGIGGDPDVLIKDPGEPLGRWEYETDHAQGQGRTKRYIPATDKGAIAKRTQIIADVIRAKDLLFDSGAWTNPAHAALVFTSALRPCIPTPGGWPRAPLFIYGGKSSGKTMTAEYLMSFWSSSTVSYQGFTSGKATATPADLEVSVGTMPIWLADDLPPSVSKTKAMREEDAVINVVRQSFDRQTRTRRRPDLSARESMDPYAQLVITAENELSIPSAWDRVNSIYLAPGSLHPEGSVTDAIAEAAKEDGLFSRITYHFVEWMVRKIAEMGWAEVTESIAGVRDIEAKKAVRELAERGLKASSIKRATILAAEMTMVLNMFEFFLGDSGTSWDILRDPDTEIDYDEMVIRTAVDNPQTVASRLESAIYDHIADSRIQTEEQKPGRLMVEALRQALNSGMAHILAAEDPSRAPITVDGEDEAYGSMSQNVALGWKPRNGELQPTGQEIGRLLYRDEEPVIMFYASEAFRLVSERLPDIIRPGSKPEFTWRSVYGEGYIDRRISPNKKTYPGYRRQAKAFPGSRKNVFGPTIRLAVLLDPDEAGEAEHLDEG